MRIFPGLTVLGVVIVAGCNLSTDLPTSQRVGIINVSQFGDGDTATLRADGVFFQTGPNIQLQLPNTSAVDDSCDVSDYNGPIENPLPHYDNLNAGPSISVVTDKVETSMVPAPNSVGSIIYSIPGGPVAFTPGSDLNFDIPGDTGGYPAQTAKVRTLLPPTLGAVERHPADNLHLSWSPAGSQSGAVQLEFLFSSDSSATPDKVMFCRLRDDGSYDIPKSIASQWAASPDDAQSLTGLRWITTIVQNNDVLLDVIIQVPITPATFIDEPVPQDIRVSEAR